MQQQQRCGCCSAPRRRRAHGRVAGAQARMRAVQAGFCPAAAASFLASAARLRLLRRQGPHAAWRAHHCTVPRPNFPVLEPRTKVPTGRSQMQKPRVSRSAHHSKPAGVSDGSEPAGQHSLTRSGAMSATVTSTGGTSRERWPGRERRRCIDGWPGGGASTAPPGAKAAPAGAGGGCGRAAARSACGRAAAGSSAAPPPLDSESSAPVHGAWTSGEESFRGAPHGAAAAAAAHSTSIAGLHRSSVCGTRITP